MLLQLNIKNFALIENLSIDFEKGFNILTGETGAGKSIIIDAINFVLGSKSGKEMIRTGENKTFVEAIFEIKNSETIEMLKDMEIEFDDLIIIARETFKSGKSIIKINNKAFSISDVKKITSTLINIHGQHENQKLLNSSSHIYYLDKYGSEKLNDLLNKYSLLYKRLQEINKEIDELGANNGEREKTIDFLKYQLDEISNAKLVINEDVELKNKFSILSNSEKINNSLISSYNILYNSDDNFISAYDLINRAIRELRNIEKLMVNIPSLVNSLEEAYFNIEQNINEIRDIQESIIYDKDELETINSRIFLIDSLKKKYGETIEDILAYKSKISDEYDKLVNSNKIIDELNKEKNKITSSMGNYSKKIHDTRCNIGEELEKKIKFELNYVGLEKSNIKIQVNYEEEFLVNGRDKVQFLISTNPGEPLKPLDKVVSGGELSRIMLSLKTVFVDKDEIPSVIFDEIDTGISGRIAQSVGEKMYLISTLHQVFCVTHLPQIASMSDTHFIVSKEVQEGKTYTLIKKLNNLEKENEIARMIGGLNITDLTLQNSKEMIKLATERKKNLINYK
ncbi:DNA repair protein RecN [Clostridium homopropionicum DSM 5847]|uniref:DNA repair protein RecN n=1 Tax=Clostridium homopropionicum DSM 5847 TaxID=1121318 RepID=A0A0L6ZD75_9CLOT|nr:DNA repair protein RecN [Clostridium homopropionicum]KOA20931.1 DNA repair protein RecN [Clostridium homopropionicum DSM 5847]SFG01930.1 DNA replication and repair protein RecN [Clostridium homopropionicum]